MFRPLSLLASQIAPTAASFPTGQPRLLRPGISCFVTSARSGYAIRPIQVIDGKRTFTFLDLQPCRLLQWKPKPTKPFDLDTETALPLLLAQENLSDSERLPHGAT